MVPDFHADIKVDAPRLVYTYPIALGPFHLSSGIIPTIEDEKLSLDGRKGHVTGISDIDLEPLYLSWSNKKHSLFIYGGADIWAPTGSYNKAKLVNLGRNYWTFGPDVFLTWYPNKKIEISTAAIVEINTTNHATNYHSGSAVSFDWSVHYRPFDSAPKLRFAVQGYYHQQFTNDTVNGAVVEDGFRGRSFAIGPQVEYDIVRHGGLLFKVDKEFDVENRPRGTKYWIEFAIPII